MPPPPSQSWVCMSDSRGGDEGPKVEQWAGSVEGGSLGVGGGRLWGLQGQGRGLFGIQSSREWRDPARPGPEAPLCSRGPRLPRGPGLHTKLLVRLRLLKERAHLKTPDRREAWTPRVLSGGGSEGPGEGVRDVSVVTATF